MNYAILNNFFLNIVLIISFIYICGRIISICESSKLVAKLLYLSISAGLLSILCTAFPIYEEKNLFFDIGGNPITILGMVYGFGTAFFAALISGIFRFIIGENPIFLSIIFENIIPAILGGIYFWVRYSNRKKTKNFSNITIFNIFVMSALLCFKDYLFLNFFTENGHEVLDKLWLHFSIIHILSMFLIWFLLKDNERLYLRNFNLREEIMIDELTKLKNYRYIVNKVYKLIEDEGKKYKYISFLMIDVDKFKIFNDTYGHLEGNKILKSLSTIMMDSVRDGDIVARYGGEEFLIILRDVNIKGAYRIAERIRENVYSMGINFANGFINKAITISIGISCYPNHGSDAIELIRKADKALYKAKELGRNKVQIYGEDDDKFSSQIAINETGHSS